MNFNVSQIRTYLECPQKHHYIYVDKRSPRKTAVALEVGIAWHRAMEAFLRTGSKEEGELAAAKYLSSCLDVKTVSTWNALLPAYQDWRKDDDWEVLDVERELTLSFGGYTLQGTLDAVVHWQGRYWHLQHKTVGASVPIPTYLAYMQRDWHECAYQRMAERVGLMPYGGTILNIVRKLSAKSILANPRVWSIHYIPRADTVVNRAMSDLWYLQARIDSPVPPVQNRSMCGGRYGNSLCPYIDVCNGVGDLTDDTLYMPTEDRYATADTADLEPST